MRKSFPILIISVSVLAMTASAALAQSTSSTLRVAQASDTKSDDAARQIVVEPQKAEDDAKAADDTAAVKDEPEKDAAATATETVTVKDDTATADAVDLPPEQVVIVLQQELQRVGCHLGALDGVWGPQSHASLEAFAHFGKIEQTDFTPTADWVALVKAKTDVVCPENYAYTPHFPPYYGPQRRPSYGGGYQRRGYGGGYGGGGYRGGYGGGGY